MGFARLGMEEVRRVAALDADHSVIDRGLHNEPKASRASLDFSRAGDFVAALATLMGVLFVVTFSLAVDGFRAWRAPGLPTIDSYRLRNARTSMTPAV